MKPKSKPKYPTIFIDIDGVLANWEWGVQNLLGLKHITTANYHVDKNIYSNEYYDAIREYQKTGKEFWYDLPELPDAKRLWEFVSRYKHVVITAIGSPEFQSDRQKRKWMLRHFAEEHIYMVERTRQKGKYANPCHILVDDQIRAIEGWIAHGGIGILHEGVETTISKLRVLMVPC